MPDLAAVDELEIAPSLEGFSFSKSHATFDDTMFVDNTRPDFANLEDNDDDDGAFNFDTNADSGAPLGDDDGAGPQDFFVGPDAVNDMDFGAGFDNDNHSDGGSMGGGGDPGQMAGGEGGPSGPYVAFDPRQMPTNLVVAMADGDGGALDYFDQNALKNWAGPEHWKLRRVIRKSKLSYLLFPSCLLKNLVL